MCDLVTLALAERFNPILVEAKLDQFPPKLASWPRHQLLWFGKNFHITKFHRFEFATSLKLETLHLKKLIMLKSRAMSQRSLSLTFVIQYRVQQIFPMVMHKSLQMSLEVVCLFVCLCSNIFDPIRGDWGFLWCRFHCNTLYIITICKCKAITAAYNMIERHSSELCYIVISLYSTCRS